MTKQARILPQRALLVLVVLIYNPRGFAWLKGMNKSGSGTLAPLPSPPHPPPPPPPPPPSPPPPPPPPPPPVITPPSGKHPPLPPSHPGPPSRSPPPPPPGILYGPGNYPPDVPQRHAFWAPPSPPAPPAPASPPGMSVYPPGTPRTFRTFDDALAASPYLKDLRCMLKRVSSSFPCPIHESSTNCTLFAATDASWEALASFVGMSVDRFEQSPIIKPLMLYQVIPGTGLSSSQLPDGVSFSTALQNEYLTVIKDPSDPTGAMYIKPTGAPQALVIERDITAAAGKMHVVHGPLVPASLVPLLTGGSPSELPIYGVGPP